MKEEAIKTLIVGRKTVNITSDKIVEFWSNVDKSLGESGCWMWRGKFTKRGYGYLVFGTVPVYTHRLSLFLSCGEMPNGMCACHKCDNPPCINPAHLFLGTHQENMQDATVKGRHASGEKNGSSKLNWRLVGEIRELAKSKDWPCYKIAKKYGVNGMTIKAIVFNVTWKNPPKNAV